MNGLGTNYLTNVGLNYFVRAISGLDTTKITEGASGSSSPTSEEEAISLAVEETRDDAIVTWDGTNAGPIFTIVHEPTTDIMYIECGIFTSGDIMPFYHAGYMAGTIYGTLGEKLTNTFTLAFKDSSE
ncbi:MAG: hypothetical protein WC554_16345 [Clostridia bacterium]|jgi:hypothetical protein